jgi:hypothetical protein
VKESISTTKSGIQVMAFWPKATLILFSNLFPIFGVIFFNWEAFPILLFYGIESVLSLTAKGYQELKKVPRKKSGQSELPTVIIYLFIIIAAILLFYLPVVRMVMIAASTVDNAVNSISNVYFILSTVILVVGILLPGIKDKKVSKRNGNHQENQALVVRDIVVFMAKFLFLMIITSVIISTSFYTASLIVIAIAKACLDIVSFFKTQQKSVGQQGLSKRP